jgi:spore coat protein CotH
MKRKYFLVVLFLILAIFLSGCSGGGIVTPSISEETQIMDLINKFTIAICNFNWDLARSYCYPDSSAYLMVGQTESLVAAMPQINDVILWLTPTIYSTDITDNEAEVRVSFCMRMWYQEEYASEDSEIATMIFIKSGGEWYFYW